MMSLVFQINIALWGMIICLAVKVAELVFQ